MAAVAVLSAAVVCGCYRRSPRAWPETLALLVHLGGWAGMLALLRYAPAPEAAAVVFPALLAAAGVTGLAAVDKSP